MNKFSELMIYFRTKGLMDTICRIKSRYFKIVEFVIFQVDLNEIKLHCNTDPDLVFRLGHIEELRQYRLEHPGLPREFYVDQTHGGKEFFLGFYKGELAQIWWVFRKGEYSRFFTFKDDSVCELNYNITLPQFRGKGLQGIFTNFMFQSLKMKNLKKIVFVISSSNVNSIKGIKKTCASELCRINSYFSFVKKTII